jgi:hypothetical protein
LEESKAYTINIDGHKQLNQQMKKSFLLMTFVVCALGISAQNTKVITGAVIDKNGNPLPNALVEATGGAENVTTDADGSFQIEVPIWLKSLTAKYAGLRNRKIRLKNNSQVIFDMRPKNSWFIDASYSVDVSSNDLTFSRTGLMGGYLGDWGGYASIMFPWGNDIKDVDCVPSVSVGVIKQVSMPVYLYLGAGYTSVFGKDNVSNVPDYESGAIFEAGVILRDNKFNLGLGYSFSSSFDNFTNHAMKISLGYCF